MIVQEKLTYELDNFSEKLFEEKKIFHDHDQLFKTLIDTFFEDFMKLFFPEVHDYINFNTVRPLSEEVFTDIFSGEHRRADIVIEANVRGEDSVIIIHVESQSTYEKNFHERMFLYYNLLYNRYRKPILPIAVYSYGEKRLGQSEYVMSFPFFKVIQFNFLTVQLSTMDWRKYLKNENPLAAALLSKMGYTEDERIQVKKEFFIMMTRLELSDAETYFLIGFFERYLKLSEEEEVKLMEELKQSEDWEAIMRLPISYEERGKKIGREEGREEGRAEGREEGREKERMEIAKELIKAKMPIDFIHKTTKLAEKQIKELIGELNRT